MLRPLLWHLPISHYSEKVRWAFDWKRVPHRRRVMPPGLHPLGGLVLSRGRVYTMPVLLADGRRIADSTDIIGWLEERHPDRPLYPADERDRARALELEDWFDENLGPAARQLGFGALLSEPEAWPAFAAKQMEGARVAVPPRVFVPVAKAFLGARYSVTARTELDGPRRKVLAALDRVEAELDGEFLVGDAFSVADLTAATLFYPVVLPEEGPWQPMRTAAFNEVQASLRDRPGFRWVEETFRRHRHNIGV